MQHQERLAPQEGTDLPMHDDARAAGAERLTATPGAERRANHRLRELVDEMLASIRAASGNELWTEEERRQCEDALAETMRRVRFEAVWQGARDA